jgi:Berberine and berberine like
MMRRPSRATRLGSASSMPPCSPFTSDQSHQNFIDGAETDYLRAYYGSNLARLVEVKRKHDPDNLFRFPQSIPLSL